MSIKKITRAAYIAALYVVLSVALAPFSFGVVQFRVSESLALLPVICPEAVLGVAVGCFISNAIVSTPIDMVVGTLATLVAALLTYKLRKVRVKKLAIVPSLPPILLNAFAIGIMLTILYTPNAKLPVYLFNILSVGAGQVVSCGILGVLLVYALEKNKTLMRFFTEK